MGLDDLPKPTQLIIKRISFGEPIDVINAWLKTKGYNQITEEGLTQLKSKHHVDIKQCEAEQSTGSIYTELITVKDLLIKATQTNEDPKALAQLVNAMNSISKTIEMMNEKEKSKKGEAKVDEKEFIAVLEFLDAEGYLKINDGRKKELIRELSETV